jgi:hypothetical protein
MVAAGMAAAGAAYAARRSERMQPELVIEETDVVIATTVAP